MWSYTHTIETEVSAESIYTLYSNVENWRLWDEGIESVHLEGPFVRGARGLLTPTGQEALPFELTAVEPGHSFSDCTTAMDGGLLIIFDHEMASLEQGSRFTTRVHFEGPMADALAPVMGPEMVEGIPQSMSRLIELIREHHAV